MMDVRGGLHPKNHFWELLIRTGAQAKSSEEKNRKNFEQGEVKSASEMFSVLSRRTSQYFSLPKGLFAPSPIYLLTPQPPTSRTDKGFELMEFSRKSFLLRQAPQSVAVGRRPTGTCKQDGLWLTRKCTDPKDRNSSKMTTPAFCEHYV